MLTEATPAGDTVEVHPTLRAQLSPILDFLYEPAGPSGRYLVSRRDTEEICVQRPNEVWVAMAGKGFEAVPRQAVDETWLRDLCACLAAGTGARFSPRRPMISAELPGGHRLQAIVGANVHSSNMALAIRLNRGVSYRMSDFIDEGAERTTGRSDRIASAARASAPPDMADRLQAAVAAGASVLIAGPTSSGKTSFLRTLVPSIPANRRVITLEDPAEVRPPHRNSVTLVTQGSALTGPDLIKSILRFSPHVVIAGELQPPESFEAYRLLISGHAAFMTTVHAGSPREAINAWTTNIALNGVSDSAMRHIPKSIAASLDLIVQLDGDRRVRSIVEPDEAWFEEG
jgi:type IV secretory pathway ATPase VirB11/archaellum biosynthesis ATPase